MREVSHTHPYTDRGAVNRPFERGPVVAADGGRREAYDEDEEAPENEADEEEPTEKMKHVDHTPPRDAESANRVFERGGAEEPVESEE
ncbi:hypothetical protein NGM10_00745 [Halorussus salilacus]|uniref:hypothetical protein n=1 Tax=Halorussus salilacus TaxID=2953750 RepID=UPI00209FA53D|nr:hypothetical protein [Halorussus salilacus]USZ68284.1 hypothetical protein NGM10_00745 [Halorussus salilacus]